MGALVGMEAGEGLTLNLDKVVDLVTHIITMRGTVGTGTTEDRLQRCEEEEGTNLVRTRCEGPNQDRGYFTMGLIRDNHVLIHKWDLAQSEGTWYHHLLRPRHP